MSYEFRYKKKPAVIRGNLDVNRAKTRFATGRDNKERKNTIEEIHRIVRGSINSESAVDNCKDPLEFTTNHKDMEDKSAKKSTPLAVTKNGDTKFSSAAMRHSMRPIIEVHEAVHRAQFEAFGQKPIGTYSQLEEEAEQITKKQNHAEKYTTTLAAPLGMSLAFTPKHGPKLNGSFNTVDEAAIAAINEINPRSIAQNIEYGGRIYMKPDGKFSYTDAVQGGPWSIDPGQHPPGTNLAGTYHTHAGPFGAPYQFSKQDQIAARANMVPEYLGTPTGAIKKYSPSGRRSRHSDFTIIQGPSSHSGDWGGYSLP